MDVIAILSSIEGHVHGRSLSRWKLFRQCLGLSDSAQGAAAPKAAFTYAYGLAIRIRKPLQGAYARSKPHPTVAQRTALAELDRGPSAARVVCDARWLL